MTKAQEEILKEAKAFFKLACEADAQQRIREKEALQFQVPKLQWDDLARQQRQGGLINTPNGQVQAPARPILSIPKLAQPIQQVINQARNAQLGVNIHPLSPDADEEVAEIKQGLYREIERDSQAPQARIWAFERAVQCGRGAYRVSTKYDDEGGHPFDQVIRIERILYQDQVYFDPSATKPDYSDGEWAFVTSWVPLERFEREFPDAKATPVSDTEFRDNIESEPNWIRMEGDVKAYLVAEYFYKRHKKVMLYLLPDGSVTEEKPPQFLVSREDDRCTIGWCKLNGFEILEEQDWPGKYIPIVPVIGSELQAFDSERRYVGIIEPNMDAQRVFNYAASNAVEMVALEPRAPWIMAEGQDENFEHEWQQSNTRNLPVLHYKPATLEGNALPPPSRVQIDVSRLGPSMQLLQNSDIWLQAGTYQYNASLGRTDSKERSGKAILAQQQMGNESNSHFLNNLADVSMQYEARVVLDLMPRIYDRPGRLARVLDEHEESEEVILNAPFYRDQETERPIPVNGQPPMPAAPGMAPPEVKEYNLGTGTYGVTISIGRSYQSKLQAGQEEIGEILTSRPELMPLLGPLYFKYRDFPGARDIADLLLKVREKQFPGLEDAEEGSPEQLAAQNQQMKQQLEQMGEQMKQMQQALETEQVKQQATLAKSQMEGQTKETIARLEQLTELIKAQMAGKGKVDDTAISGAQQIEKARVEGESEIQKEAVKGAFSLKEADLNAKVGLIGGPLTGERDVI